MSELTTNNLSTVIIISDSESESDSEYEIIVISNPIKKVKPKPIINNNNNENINNNIIINDNDIIVLDCEMVETYYDSSSLAKITILNYKNEILINEIIRPIHKVINYRTFIHGITKDILHQGKLYHDIIKEVESIIQNKIIIGHSLHFDFKALKLNMSNYKCIDISKFYKYKDSNNQIMSLKRLSKEYLQLEIQDSYHCSVEDCVATLELYKLHKTEINKQLLIK